MITIAFLLLVSAFILIIANAYKGVPLWIAVLLINIYLLLSIIPLK